MFTSFKLDLDIDEIYGVDKVVYVLWGKEVCPKTGRDHLQGYIELSDGVSFKRLKKIIGWNGVWLGRRKGSAAEAITYCKKDGDVHERGDPGKQGARGDLRQVLSLVKGGEGMRGVIDTGASYQALRYAEKCLTFVERGRDAPPEVHWYWGGTGTGKTRAVVAAAERSYGLDQLWWSGESLQWFSGYDAHPLAVFDDFRDDMCRLPWLLRLLDRYPVPVPYKGGFRSWLAETIYITSAKPPTECYLDQGERIEQLLRRITVVKEFKEISE